MPGSTAYIVIHVIIDITSVTATLLVMSAVQPVCAWMHVIDSGASVINSIRALPFVSDARFVCVCVPVTDSDVSVISDIEVPLVMSI